MPLNPAHSCAGQSEIVPWYGSQVGELSHLFLVVNL